MSAYQWQKGSLWLMGLLFMWAVACKQQDKTPADPDIYYTCSMDPQVVEYKPGKCPICKMDLTPVRKKTGEAADELQLSEQQVQLGNIQVDTMGKENIGDQLVLTGVLNFNQEKMLSVSSRVMGRLEVLYFKNVGDYVEKGKPLFRIYSEDLNNAKQEYLLAIEQKKAFEGETTINYDRLLESAKNKLLLWGMTESQVNELAAAGQATPLTTFYSTASGYITELPVKEGDYVMEGGVVVKLADLSTLWAEAQVYSSQWPEVDQAGEALVRLPELGGLEIRGRIDFVNPELSPDTRINLLRVTVSNPSRSLKPGMPAYIMLKSPSRKGLTLPIDAVIRDEHGAVVWVETKPLTYKSVMVKTGLESGDRIEILSGIAQGDRVVVTGAYLLHSEYVFKKGSSQTHQHD